MTSKHSPKISTSYVRKQLLLILKCCSSLITLLAFTLSYLFRQFNLLVCSVGLQDRLERLRHHLVADLGVGNSPVFLAQVKAQLALVAEVKVALFALVKHEVNRSNQQ